MAHGKAPRKPGGMVRIRRRVPPWAACFVLIGLGATDGPPPRRFEFVETHMGSPFQIILYTEDEALARSASRRAFDRIKALDASFSDYNAESELSKLSDQAGGPPFKISQDLFDILARSKSMAERSQGAFDPTIAPVGRLWRRARRERKLPDPETLAKALKLVGHDRLILDAKARTAQLATAGMRLDLGGIAKGYASQAAIDVLKKEGVPSALVAGAGDIAAGDPPPGPAGWVVGVAPIEDPGTAPPERRVLLKNTSISTSGDAERYVEIAGIRYSHILDPKTGVGLTRRTSVTVIHPQGATADALATAVTALGPEAGLTLVENTPGASCLIVQGIGKDRKTWTSPGFPGALKGPRFP